MPGRSKLGLDAMRGRASVADGRASEVPGLSRACCSARNAVPDVSGRDASINGWGSKNPQPASLARAATGSWCAACCWRWRRTHRPSSVSGGAAKVPFRCRYARSSSKRPSQSSESCTAFAAWNCFEARAQARVGLGFGLQGLHGHRRGMSGLPRSRAACSALFGSRLPAAVAFRGALCERPREMALRTRSAGGPVVVSVVLQQGCRAGVRRLGNPAG